MTDVRPFHLVFGVCKPSVVVTPAQYDTYAEADADAAIEEFLADVTAEVAAGERPVGESYDRDEFAVVEVEAE